MIVPEFDGTTVGGIRRLPPDIGAPTDAAHLGQEKDAFRNSILFPVLIIAVGIGIASIGFKNNRKIAGAIALGAGSSMAGAGIALLLGRLV